MAKTTFTFTTVDGITATRTSARPYSHVVVGRVDNVRARAGIEANRDLYASNWCYWKTIVAVPVGELPPDGYSRVTQEQLDKARATLDRYPTEQAYVDAEVATRLAEIGEGDAGPLTVLQWSMSVSSARRAVPNTSKYFLDVHVLPINGEQPASAPKAPAPPAALATVPAPALTAADLAQVERAVSDAIELVDSVAFVREEGDNTGDVLERLRKALAIIQRN